MPPRRNAPAAEGGAAPQPGLLSIILPTYNEADNLPIVIWLLARELSKSNIRYEVVVVDDASPDGTQDVVHALAAVYGDDVVRLAARPGKLGLGSAYLHGLKFARGDKVVIMDADLSHHPKFIPRFVAAMDAGDLDVVTGTRYAPGGGVAGWDVKRKLISRGANFVAATLLNPGVSDLTGSFRLYRRPVLEALVSTVRSRGYVFQMEIMARAKASGLRVGEVPITFVDRLYGTSKLGGTEIVAYLKGLAQLFFAL